MKNNENNLFDLSESKEIKINDIVRFNKDKEPFVINARELWQFLGNKQKFTDWLKNRIEKYSFCESKDYRIHKIMTTVGVVTKEQSEYFITLDMAKELSMLENNEKGSIARKYFIACEKELKKVQEIIQKSDDELILQSINILQKRISLQQSIIENQANKIEDDRPKVDAFNDLMSSDGLFSISNTAKVLGLSNAANPNIGRDLLFKLLRKDGFLAGRIANQQYINQGLFVISINNINIDGKITPTPQTFVTPKGLDYLRKKYKV